MQAMRPCGATSEKVEPSVVTRTSSARTAQFSVRPARVLSIVVLAYSASQMPPSPAKKAAPSAGRPSMSSNLVAATVSIVPNVSRCCGPTEVSRPYFGCTRSTSSAMSPLWRAPISARNTWWRGCSCSRTMRVMPMGVLKDEGVARTSYFSERIVARMNLVLVLP